MRALKHVPGRWARALSFALLSSLSAQVAVASGGHVNAVAPADAPLAAGPRTWLAGDHHIHSESSAEYESNPADPMAMPKPLFDRDGRYTVQKNAEVARSLGLAWMVSTDHGGPNRAQINHDIAYPELQKSRRAVPEVLQFFGMEFGAPVGDHSSLIVPRTDAEQAQLRELEAGYSQKRGIPARSGTRPARPEDCRSFRDEGRPARPVAGSCRSGS